MSDLISSNAWTGKEGAKKPPLNEWADMIDEAIYDYSKILNLFFSRKWLSELGEYLEDQSQHSYEYRQYGTPSQYNYGPSDTELELRKVKKQLKEELAKTTCEECNGNGYIRFDGPAHYTNHECHKCHGQGRK